MLRVANVFISFYAALFALAKWGILGGTGVVLTAVLVDRILRAHAVREAVREERARSERLRAEKQRQISDFADRGCRFFGNQHEIFEFEHLADLTIALDRAGLSDISVEQRQIIESQKGFVLAFRRAGWPVDLDRWKTRRLLDSVVDRPTRHFPTSDLARRIEQQRAEAELRAVEARIAERRTSLKQRRRDDLGEGATSVYVIASKDQSQSKIGISESPTKRRAGLQTGNPAQLSLHSTYWMSGRDDALLLERQTHRVLRSKGYFQIGEWFNIEPAVADRVIGEVYDELMQRGLIVEQSAAVPASAVESDLLEGVCSGVRWTYSKRGNLTTRAFGKRITVFYKRKAWHWVCDSKFSESAFPAAEQAQRSAISSLGLTRDELLAIVSKRGNKIGN